MQEFDEFAVDLFEEATRFFEKANESKSDEEKKAYLHASILLGMSSLEAFLNAIAEELLVRPDLPLQEQAILAEKDIKFNKGKFELGNQLKIYRVIDRIEFIYCKFSGKSITNADLWHQNIKQSISLRNSLIHPKNLVAINEKQAENVLKSILDTVNQLYLSIYRKGLPIYLKGLQSKLSF